jgi:PAS domain S-box-containing protein
MAAPDDTGARSTEAGASRVPLDDPAFLRAVLEAIPAVVVRLDSQLRITYVNHMRGGLTPAQVFGRPASEHVAPPDLEAFRQAVEHVLRTGETRSYFARGVHPVPGVPLAHFQCHAALIEEADGRRDVCIVATDVSEHVARAHELQRSEEKLRVAVEATGIGLWTWHVDTDVIECDPRFVELVGFAPATGREFRERVFHPDDRARAVSGTEAARRGQPAFAEHRIVRPDGEVRWLLPRGRVIRDEAGRVVRITGGTLDVTAQRKTEEQLRHAQKLEAIGSLTAGVAHNFNNMLAIMLPAFEVAQRTADADHAPLFEDALHAARRAAELVRQLMTFAGRRGAPTRVSADLGPLIERAVSLCRRTFDGRVSVHTSAASPCSAVICDPAAIEQVVVNLVINAWQAVEAADRPEPWIGVEWREVERTRPDVPLSPPERFACIRVEDNGVGMDDSVRQRLFEPFFTTKGPHQGTGLGLATSYGIVRDHGGFITFDSRPGVGTRAEVFLPCAVEKAAAVAPAGPAPVSASRGAVLVVDDEPPLGRILESMLCTWGHEVRVAIDGPATVAMIDSGFRPDLILLDIRMPGWPAHRTLDEIRQRMPAVPVLFVTGQDVTSDERQRVQDVLYKPFTGEQLKEAVDRWLARPT